VSAGAGKFGAKLISSDICCYCQQDGTREEERVKRLLVGLTVVTCIVGRAAGDAQGAQDALTTLPGSYRLQFENEWVKIVRVQYAPHAKLPAHTHTERATAYVYLNDAGPVIFKHIGLDYGAVTRPATKAGSFRLYRGLEELHEVENTTAVPSHFLRVEFKTDPKEPRTLRGKFFREAPAAPGENFEKVQFENVQVRITRILIAPGKSVTVSTKEAEPSVFIALTPATCDVMPTSVSGSGHPLTLAVGQEHWVGRSSDAQVKNQGTEAAELLRFDFKTKPLS
jgi:hypothetical protein